jgi:hypothetical protein
MQALNKQSIVVQGLLVLAILAELFLWLSVRETQARWANVPPIPSEAGITAFTLGDKQFAYRIVGVMLQNFGDTGGRSTAFKEYDYEELTRWMFLADSLDPVSNYAPYLAAYYFGAIPEAEKFRPMLEYLRTVGLRSDKEKWRWLWQAVFISRFGMRDFDKALELANELAAHPNPDIPSWARQMPAFVLTDKGDKQAALAVMVELLKTDANKMEPAEVNSILHYICDRLLDESEAQSHALCQDLK